MCSECEKSLSFQSYAGKKARNWKNKISGRNKVEKTSARIVSRYGEIPAPGLSDGRSDPEMLLGDTIGGQNLERT